MTVDQLRPGDCLLYRPNSFWGYAIAAKTWNFVSHCECFVGNGESVASRDGLGVSRYPLRTAGLYYVLRPNQPFDLAAALAWFATVNGQKYDWAGLARFVTWKRLGTDLNDKMFCSEFLTRFYRAGKFFPFSNFIDADCVAPASFLYSPFFDEHDYDSKPKGGN